MDVASIKADLATVAAACEFNAWPYFPDDLQQLPAAVVGNIEDVQRKNRAVTIATYTVTFYVSLADPFDAAARLDLVLSEGIEGSFLTALAAAVAPAWSSITFASSGPYQVVALPTGARALSVDIRLLVAG